MPTKNAPAHFATLKNLVTSNDLDGMEGLKAIYKMAQATDLAEEYMLDTARKEADRAARVLADLVAGRAPTVTHVLPVAAELPAFYATFVAKREALIAVLHMAFDGDLVQEFVAGVAAARTAQVAQ